MDDCITKLCTKCGIEKPATTEYFYFYKRGKYGVYHYCIICERKRAKEKYAKRGDELRQVQREYYAENSKARILYQIEYNHTHREQSNAYSRKYGKLHRDIAYAAHHRRRARIKGNGGSHTPEDVQLQYRTQKGKCWWCGKKLNGKYEIDHRIPISRGGTDWPNNIVCSCKKCNRYKTNKLPHEWNGRLI